MEQRYTIELIEEHEQVNFYSIKLEEEELAELDRFFEKFPEGCEYDDEIDVILAWMDYRRAWRFGTLFPSRRQVWRWCRRHPY